MNPGSPVRFLEQALNELALARRHLEHSYRRVVRVSADLEAVSADELESVEAFTSRFARTVDLLVNKVLRALDRASCCHRAHSWTRSTGRNSGARWSGQTCCGR